MEEPTKEALILFNESEFIEVVKTNAPVILEKVQIVEAVLTPLDVEIKTVEQDAEVEAMLVKASKTFDYVVGLADEIKKPLKNNIVDKINATLKRIDTTKGSGSIYQKVKLRRDAWVTELARLNKEKQATIDKEKNKKTETTRVKAEMQKAMITALSMRVAKGEEAIAKLFRDATLETIDELKNDLSFKPSLKPDWFKTLFVVAYNKDLLTEAEFIDLHERAFVYFNFEKCNDEYIDEVVHLQTKWIGKIPARKAELEELFHASQAEAEQLRKDIADREARELKAREESLTSVLNDVNQEATIATNKGALDSEFEAQIGTQSLEALGQTRTTYRYRFADEDSLIEHPLAVISILEKVMLHVMTEKPKKGENALYMGIYERSKVGLPKRDDKNDLVYLDAIDYWLKLLVKVDPAAEIPGLTREEIKSSVQKKKD